jgi:hypothetical protein
MDGGFDSEHSRLSLSLSFSFFLFFFSTCLHKRGERIRTSGIRFIKCGFSQLSYLLGTLFFDLNFGQSSIISYHFVVGIMQYLSVIIRIMVDVVIYIGVFITHQIFIRLAN